jgi:hypothetical protein
MREIAIIKAKEGDHKEALTDLETLMPMLRHATPDVFFATINSLAVEPGERGEFDAAERTARLVSKAPMLEAYPEWQATPDESREARQRLESRSAIRPGADFAPTIPEKAPEKVVSLPDYKAQHGTDNHAAAAPFAACGASRVIKFKSCEIQTAELRILEPELSYEQKR